MSPEEKAARERVDAAARSWVNTPYHAHAEIKGAGVDCAKLLKVVYQEAGVVSDVDIPYYSPQFFMHSSDERFIAQVTKYAHEIAEADAKPGDVVLYKVGHCYAHSAIIVSPGWPKAVVHADAKARRVIQCGGLDGLLGVKIRHPRFFSHWG